MAERRKFEEMLERLVNEDAQGAKDLFHEIVVEKSRKIYESLLESDMYDEELEEDEDLEEGDELEEDFDLEEDEELEEGYGNPDPYNFRAIIKRAQSQPSHRAKMVHMLKGMLRSNPEDSLKIKAAIKAIEDMGMEGPQARGSFKEDFDIDEDWDLEEDFDIEEDFDLEEDDFDEAMMADPTDDLEGDLAGGDDAYDLEGGIEDEGDVENRVADLEDELDALKAEFEDMMSDMGDEDDDMDMDDEVADLDMDDEDDDMDMGDEDDDMDMGDEDNDMGDEDDDMGDEDDDEAVAEGEKSVAQLMREYTEKVTANMGDDGAYTKSPVAGSNDMGGTTANIVSGGDGGTGGKVSSPKDMNTGNVNVPGGKAAKSMSKQGGGAAKKGDGAKSMLS